MGEEKNEKTRNVTPRAAERDRDGLDRTGCWCR
jgi:hypothetical protein